jgi:outer membrane protein assembly factor BamB
VPPTTRLLPNAARLALLAIACSLLSPASAQEWTRFRGPNGTGITAAKGIPVTWTEQDFRWRIPIAGESHSQPVIWGDKLFLTTATDAGKQRVLLCLNKNDGKELWSKKYELPTHRPQNRNASYANGSPVVDAERVVASFVSADHFWVRCFDHGGKELWSHDLGTFTSQHGHGASPMFYENTVIVTNDQDGESFVVAFDVKTGNLVWTTPRRGVKGGTAYATPCIHPRPGESPELLLASQGHGISGLDPKTGKILWEAPVYDKRMIASPVVAGDLVIGSCGQGGGQGNYLSAVKLGGKGDVSATNVAYTLKRATNYVPTPLFLDGILYIFSDNGIASALEPATGKTIWAERMNCEFFGSPVIIDGKIYAPTVAGEMVVLATGNTFKLLGRNPLGEGTRSTPCVDGGRLYMKTYSHLVCIGGK